ncbi:MAG: tetratricopeptide repeat protein [Leptospirales bacterium]|nr:tetratricopeptide repeat protein [Leptospirales bacterium]
MTRFTLEDDSRTPLFEGDPLKQRRRFRLYVIAGAIAFILLPIGGWIGYYYWKKAHSEPETLLDQKLQSLDLDGLKDRIYIPEEQVSLPLQKAIEFYKSNNRDQAKREFQNFILTGASDHEKAIALTYLGIMAMESEKFPLAEHNLLRAIKLDEKFVPALVNLSIVSQKLGKVGEARQFAERARELAPKDPRVAALLGNLLAANQDLAGAIDTYREGIKANPDDATLTYNLAVSLLRRQNYEEAILYFSKVIAISPGSEIAARSQAQLGQIYFAKGNFEMAADHMQKAITVAPGNAKYLYNLGIIYLRMRKNAEAVTAFKRALDAGSGDAAVFRGLAAAFSELKQPALAIKALKKGLYLNPDDLASLFLLGDLYLDEKDLLNAADTYKRIVNITPGDKNTEDALLRLGSVYTELERFNDAQDALERVTSINPGNVQASYALGIVYRKAGRMEMAIQVWKRALNPPGNPDSDRTGLAREEERTIRIALADVYRKNGAFDLALNEYKLIAARNRETPVVEEDPSLDLDVARTYLQLRSYDVAIKSYRMVSDARTATPEQRKEAFRGLALAYSNSGKPEDLDAARSEINKAIRMDPDDSDLQLMRAGMLMKTGSMVDREKAIEVLTALTAGDMDSNKASQAYNLLGLAYHKNGEYKRALRAFDSAIQLNPQNREAYENQRVSSNAFENQR